MRQGIDIEDVRRVQQAIEQHGNAFLEKTFSAQERNYCDPKRMKYEHYAVRLAAKEAVLKALRVNRKTSFSFREIEIRHHATGRPYVYLSPQTRKRLKLPKKQTIELSMAHERTYAVAMAVVTLS